MLGISQLPNFFHTLYAIGSSHEYGIGGINIFVVLIVAVSTLWMHVALVKVELVVNPVAGMDKSAIPQVSFTAGYAFDIPTPVRCASPHPLTKEFPTLGLEAF